VTKNWDDYLDEHEGPSDFASGQSSVTIKRDAKGNAVFEVKVYDIDPDIAAAKATVIYCGLEQQYPRAPHEPTTAKTSRGQGAKGKSEQGETP